MSELLPINRDALESVMKRRFFTSQAFEIYGGVAGLWDLGPPGVGLKANMLNLWRKHFVVGEGMLEIEGTCLTPENVLKTSGHVDKFTDYMVTEVGNPKGNQFFRADKLLEEEMDKLMADEKCTEEDKLKYDQIKGMADAYSKEDLHAKFVEFDIRSPANKDKKGEGLKLSEPKEFNLMFSSSIGPGGHMKGYLRPETAQGIFVNFKRLLDFNQQKMPFGCAQLGLGFRNEIAPRAGLLRVREFQMAEIEYFVHPDRKDHARFHEVKDHVLSLFPIANQQGDRQLVKKTAGEAVADGTIDNETLAYFIVRTAQFAKKIGLRDEGVRFRQHLPTEMAHYAKDCWDLEVLTTYGWIECAGHADRSCFDLTAHADATKQALDAYERYAEPIVRDVVKATPVKKLLGKKFGKTARQLFEWFNTLTNAEAEQLEKDLAESGATTVTLCNGAHSYELSKDEVTFEKKTVKESGASYLPSVIEPSFGIGRLLYCLLEHSFYARDGDEQRTAFSFNAAMAPTKVTVLPLSNNAEFEPFLAQLRTALADEGVAFRIDTGGASIGRRYARADELGTPYGVTVDFDTTKTSPPTVTLRERDTLKQVRLALSDVAGTLRSLTIGKMSWDDVMAKFPEFTGQEE